MEPPESDDRLREGLGMPPLPRRPDKNDKLGMPPLRRPDKHDDRSDKSRGRQPNAGEPEVMAMEPESDDGNVEYKLKLTDATDLRVQRLASQMRYRCDEGGSECIYRLGVEDDGTMTGLTDEDYQSTMRCIRSAAAMNSYSVHALCKTPVPNGGGRCVYEVSMCLPSVSNAHLLIC